MFQSVYQVTALSDYAFFICAFTALVTGIVFSVLCSLKIKSSKSFFMTSAILPMAVAVTIALVNGNVGVGVAVAGAFSLVRFRSAQGNAKEMSIIFIAMASGLAFGMGYIGYGVVFLAVSALVLLLLEKTSIFEKKNDEKTLTVFIPESLDYTDVFTDVFDKHLQKAELLSVKTTNMGSLFKLKYAVVLRNPNGEKAFIDALRIRNGNLEIALNRTEEGTEL